MEPAAGAAEGRQRLQGGDKRDKHRESGWDPEPHRNGRKCNYKKRTIVLTVVTLVLIAVIVLAALRSMLPSADLGPPAVPCCSEDWVGYRGKCYYFSEAEGNWNHSQNHCSAFNASLAGIDSEEEMDFLLRYKGRFDHWIGLRRDPGQPWKWANGSEFNNTFVIRGGGDCVYLNDENGVSSLRCTSERYWICTRPDAFTQAKEDVGERD